MERYKLVILSSAKNLKTAKILRFAQNDKKVTMCYDSA